MTLRILHAATHNHNIGDGALVAGMHRVLREDLGVPLEFHGLDVLDCKLEGRRQMLATLEVAELGQRFDLVLVGGGGMIEGGKGNYLSGINFNFPLSAIEDSGIPWVFYALGHNQFRRSFFFHRRRLRALLRRVEDGGHLFSVRNDGSEARLRGLTKGDPPVTTIPDPGLWVPPGDSATPAILAGRPNVLVQLAGDRSSRRFAWRRRRLLRRLAGVLVGLVEEHGVHLVLCPHLLGDLPLFTELLHHIPARLQRQACTMGPVLKGAAAAPAFFDLYRRADLVIGMRGHSVICGVGAGKPVIGLASHDKVGGFLRELGLEDWVVDVDVDRRLDQLQATANALLVTLDAAAGRVRDLLPGLRDDARRFHHRIAALLKL